jgi:hypothetical protein
MKQKYILIIFFVLFFLQMTQANYKVYIIHGYGGFTLQMEKINSALQSQGYVTENYSYSDFSENLDSLGRDLYQKIQKENMDTVSFVTHSMGALLVRSMYQYMNSADHFPVVHRMVMVAPPNKGSKLADFFSGSSLKFLLGPNVELMRTDTDSYANNLPVPTCEIGIIAGIRGRKPWFNPFLKEDNDGNVTPHQALLGSEKDFAVVKASHALITQQKQVIALILTFMKTGAFQRAKNK